MQGLDDAWDMHVVQLRLANGAFPPIVDESGETEHFLIDTRHLWQADSKRLASITSSERRICTGRIP